MMTKDEARKALRGFFDSTAEFCAERFRELGEIQPMFVAITESREVLIMPVFEFSTPDQKDELLAQVKAVLKAKGAISVVFVTEAWMVSGPTAGAAARLARNKSIEHHPDRIEVISIAAETKDEVLHGHMQILRPEHGPPMLAPIEVHHADHFKGRMFGLLRDD